MTTFITRKPIDNISTTVSSEFGKRVVPHPTASNQHLGIDFAIPLGTRIYSAHTGTVIKSGTARGLGNVLVIKDNITGKATLYAHLGSLSQITDSSTHLSREIAVGDRISAGTLVALSGSSGTSTGAHLHFEILTSDSTEIVRAKSTSTSLGIDGQSPRENPRQHLAEAFPNEFSLTVNAESFGIDLEGDNRDNALLGNSRANDMTGLGGFDTYRVNFGDTIDDTNLDGRIVIDTGSRQVLFEGNALPKKNGNGNIIPNQWSLNGYDLARNGNDLEISKPQAISEIITIKNYPFSLDKKAFGISLGKEKTGQLEKPKLVTDPEFIGSAIFASANRRGLFFTPASIDSGIAGNYKKDFAIKTYDSSGAPIKTEKLTSLLPNRVDGNGNRILQTAYFLNTPFYLGSRHQSYRFPNGNVGFVYATQETTYTNGNLYIARINSSLNVAITDSYGNVTSNKTIYSEEILRTSNHVDENNRMMNTALRPHTLMRYPQDGKYYVAYIRAGQVANNYIAKAEISFDGNLIGPWQSGDLNLYAKDQFYYHNVTLPDFTQIKVIPYQGLNVSAPALRNMSLESTPESEVINPSQLVRTGENLQSIFTFQPTSDEEEISTLRIVPHANAKSVIRGIEYGNIDLSSFDLDPQEIAEITSEVDESQVTLQDIFANRYKPYGDRRRDINLEQLMPERGDNLAVDEDELETHARTRRNASSQEDDDYYEDVNEVPGDEDLEFNPEIFTVINLPNDQQVIFPGIGRAEFLNITFPQLNNTIPQINNTNPEVGMPGNGNNLGPMGLGLLIGGIIVGVTAAVIGIYKLITGRANRINFPHEENAEGQEIHEITHRVQNLNLQQEMGETAVDFEEPANDLVEGLDLEMFEQESAKDEASSAESSRSVSPTSARKLSAKSLEHTQ